MFSHVPLIPCLRNQCFATVSLIVVLRPHNQWVSVVMFFDVVTPDLLISTNKRRSNVGNENAAATTRAGVLSWHGHLPRSMVRSGESQSS
jgi:branched-subunit amino acid transport protein